MEILLILYILLFVVLMVCYYLPAYERYYLLAKSSVSLIFVMIAVKNMIQDQKPLIWLSGFLFCFLGDVLLGIKKKGRPRYFVAGLSAFLLGHLFFIIRMRQIHAFSGIEWLMPVAFVGLTTVLLRLEHMDVKKMHLPIYFYAFVVSMMLANALYIGIHVQQLHAYGLAFGAFLFLISDFILLFIYFYRKQWQPLKFLNLFCYYSAVLCLTVTLP